MQWQHGNCKQTNITTETVAITDFSAFHLIYEYHLVRWYIMMTQL